MNDQRRTCIVSQCAPKLGSDKAVRSPATTRCHRLQVRSAFCWGSLSVAVLAGAANRLAAEEPNAAVRAELFTQAEQHLVQRDRLARSLVGVAKDELVSGTERERAVKLLAMLQTEEGRVFMLSNLSMRINHGRAKTDDDQARRWACLYYLTERGYRDWNTVSSILGMLDKELPKEQIGMFPYVLRTVSNDHPGVAKAILEAELKQETNEPRKSQLARLREALER